MIQYKMNHSTGKIFQTFPSLWSMLILISLLSPYIYAGGLKKSTPRAFVKKEEIKTEAGKDRVIPVETILPPPFLDGTAIDECWKQTPATKIRIADGKILLPVYLKACTDGRKIYILVQYQTAQKARKHQTWHWHPVIQAYIPGKEEEEAFTIILSKDNSEIKKADIWIWRAARTDPVNKADDLVYQECELVAIPRREILMDVGSTCWFSKYFGDYAGAELPRFYNRTPKGSLSDVNAKGSWDKNFLSIEFSRLLDTGNEDDIPLKAGTYYIQIHRGTPDVNTINKNQLIPLVVKAK